MDEQNTSGDGQGESGFTSGLQDRPGIGLLIVIGIILSVYGLMALAMNLPTRCECRGTESPPTQQPLSTWRVYHDPLGLFTLRLPPGWRASSWSIGPSSTDGPAGSDTPQAEQITFRNASLGPASPSLSVYAMQIRIAAPYCAARVNETSSFNGYPADISQPAVLLFESENAHFRIDETIPGVLAPVNPGGLENHPTPPPAPPAATVTAERTLLAGLLASFRPTARPLACG